MSIKGKLFSVLVIFLCVSNVVQAADPWPQFSGVMTGGESESLGVMILDSTYPEAGLSPGVHHAFKFDSYVGGNKGYIDILGIQDVTFTNIFNSLTVPPVVANASIQDREVDSPFAFYPSAFSELYEDIGMIDMVLTSAGSQYSFSDFIIAGHLPDVVASWIVVPTSYSTFTSILDVQINPEENRYWIFEARIGEGLTSPIPEPSTYAMILIGLFFLSLWSRRQMRYDPGKIIF